MLSCKLTKGNKIMSIGERIKQARNLGGLSLRDLASKVGLSAQAISKYERDIDTPNSENLLKISKALKVKVAYFLRSIELSALKPEYRKKHHLGKKNEKQILALIHDWLERYLEMESILSSGDLDFKMPRGFPKTVSSLDAVEECTQNLREIWKLEFRPIENLIELLEVNNFKVGLVKAGSGFDACTFKTEDHGQIPVIAIKDNLPGDRQRFNLAHELGHILLNPSGNLDSEKMANRFAGAFLVPKKSAISELGGSRESIDPLELFNLKHKYKMSMMAWIYRAKDLAIITESCARHYFQMFRIKHWHLSEPGKQLEAEQPRRFYQLVAKALSEDIISESKATELLGMPIIEFRKEVFKEVNGQANNNCF